MIALQKRTLTLLQDEMQTTSKDFQMETVHLKSMLYLDYF